MKAAVLLGLLCLASSAVPTRAIAATADTPQARKECSVAAMITYNKATLELLQQQQETKLFYPTIEMMVARRRLQEQFCLQFVQCNFPDVSNQTLAVEYSIAFDNCLRDEAREEYKDIFQH